MRAAAEGKRKRGISGSWLKMIAIVTMLIDHTAATILLRLLQYRPPWGPVTSATANGWNMCYIIMRGIGRMAFPIYCFLLVEGFTYTRSRIKYALRLFVFALVSEIPFDMAFKQSFFDRSYNNVFFTLLIGLLVLMASEAITTRVPKRMGARSAAVVQTILRIAVLLAGCFAAERILRTDYGACGVLAIFILYVFRNQRTAGFAFAVVVLGLLADGLELAALLMLIPIYFYNGERGRQVKYFFYAFYPVHLLILSLICYALGLGI